MNAGNAIGNLTTGPQASEGPAFRVGQSVDFRRVTAARSADGLIVLPLFYSAGGQAVRIDGGTVDQDMLGRTAGAGERLDTAILLPLRAQRSPGNRRLSIPPMITHRDPTPG